MDVITPVRFQEMEKLLKNFKTGWIQCFPFLRVGTYLTPNGIDYKTLAARKDEHFYLSYHFNAAITLVIRVQSLYKLQMEVRKSRSTVGLPLFEMKGLMAVWKDIQTKKLCVTPSTTIGV